MLGESWSDLTYRSTCVLISNVVQQAITDTYRINLGLQKAACFKTNPNLEHREVAATDHRGATLRTKLTQNRERTEQS